MKCLFIQVMGCAGLPSRISQENFDFFCSSSTLWNKGEVWIWVQKASEEIAQTFNSIVECGVFCWLSVMVLRYDAIGWCLSS